ncbi:MAG: Phosphoheptose isomerase 1 [Alphaproteobacteria bacterium MarineAlpha3_Bin5]|nr:phosphoheptose isomerase [Magnetovibrio sp.]PPR79761.1 MAG: Phosphoheptose isomerase 1 [Alphaproteobacteria bacterium MarineAlpha3_Bin5]
MLSENFFEDEFGEHAIVVTETQASCREAFEQLLEISVKSLKNGGKLMFFGNGGSAADSQHLATELSIRYKADRSPIAAIALTTDTSALTAASNDFGIDEIFARQLEAIGRSGDVAIGISTSGNSKNVIRALERAKALNIVAAGFGGKSGGEMIEIANPFLIVPSTTTSRIQEMHILLGHMLCGALEKKLGLV